MQKYRNRFIYTLICIMYIVSVGMVEVHSTDAAVIYDYDFSSTQPFNLDTVCTVEDTGDVLYGDALKISTVAEKNTNSAVYGECRGINLKRNRVLLSFDLMPMQTDTFFSFLVWNQNSRSDFRLNLDGGKLYATNDSVSTKKLDFVPKTWYSIDILIDYLTKTVSVFADGEQIGSFATKYEDSDTFGAFCAGVWQKGTSGICYLDNLKICDADTTSQCIEKIQQIDERRVAVKFGESISAEDMQSFETGVSLKGADGKSVTVSDISVKGRNAVITAAQELGINERYVVTVPSGIKSVLGNNTNEAVVDFVSDYEGVPIISRELGGIDFENGTIGKNITFSTKNSPDYEIVDSGDGGKALKYTAKKNSDGSGTRIDFKILGDDKSKRKIIVEYDFKIGQADSFAFRHTMSDTNGAEMFNSLFNAKNKLVAFTEPNIYPDYKICWESVSSSKAKLCDISPMAWHKIKLVFDRASITEEFSGTTEIYIDDTYITEFDTPDISGQSGILNTVSFSDVAEQNGGWGSNPGDVIFIDNINVGYPDAEKVKSVNVLMDNKISPQALNSVSADLSGIEIAFTEDIDISTLNKSNISLSDGSNYIDFGLGYYNVNSKSVVLNLENGLKPNTTYMLRVKNICSIYGDDVKEFNTEIKTDNSVSENEPNILQCYIKSIEIKNNKAIVSGRYSAANSKLKLQLKKKNQSLNIREVLTDSKGEFCEELNINGNGRYCLLISGNGKTEQLEFLAGSVNKKITADISTGKTGNIFSGCNDLTFTVNVSGIPYTASDYIVSYRITDVDGNTVSGIEKTEASADKLSEKIAVSLNDFASQYGIFKIQFEISDCEVGAIIETETRFSCINSVEGKSVSKRFGFSNHYRSEYEPIGENYMKLQGGIGAMYSREEITWDDFETADGVYALTDNRRKWLEDTVAAGMKPYVILAFSNPRFTDENPPVSDYALKKFGDYVYNLVLQTKEYGVTDYEVWNEYNLLEAADPTMYVKLLKTAYERAKEANENCTVYGICAANVNKSDKYSYSTQEWIDAVLSGGGGEYMDSLSIHPYPYSDEITPESSGVDKLIAEIEATMQKYGVDIPIMASEYGWTSRESYMNPDERQAKYNVRGAALTYELLDYVIWYQISEIDNSPSSYFGFLRAPTSDIPLEAKLSYIAMANFVRQTNGKRLVEKSVKDGKYAYKFVGDDGGTVWMLWTEDRDDSYTISKSAYEIKHYDMYGNCKILSSDDGSHTVAVSGNPIYIEIPYAVNVCFKNNGNIVKDFRNGDKISIDIYKDSEFNADSSCIYAVGCKGKKLLWVDRIDLSENTKLLPSTDLIDTINVFVWSKNSLKPVAIKKSITCAE